jgi:hypothetical protein
MLLYLVVTEVVKKFSVCYRIQISLQFSQDCISGLNLETNLVHALISHLLKIHFITPPSIFRFSLETSLCFQTKMLYMFPIWSMIAVPPDLYVITHIWQIVKVSKPLTARFSPPWCYFLFCSSKYSPQHSTLLKHPHIYSYLLSVKVSGSVSSNMKHNTAFP